MITIEGIEYLTSYEVCEEIGYSRSTLMKRIQAGVIKQIIHNKRALFRKVDVEKLKETNDYFLYGETNTIKYTTKELAGVLGIAPTTLYRWFNDGKVKGTKVGRFTYYTEEDVLSIIEQMRVMCQSRPQFVRDEFGINDMDQ